MGFWEFLGDVAEGALEYQSIVANENAEYVDKGIRCYKNGNYNEAFRYFKMAAERNNSNAMYNLALCYRYGEGTDMDYEEAVYWYRKAAEKGVSGAKEAIDEIGSDTGCLIQKDDLFAIRKGYITKFSLSNVSYSWNGNNYTDRKVTIKIGRLQNESAHHSGSVKLMFWYCKTAYNGDHLDGTLMAEDVYSSSGSRGNCYGWSDIEFVMDMDGNPPTGDYFPVLTINELDEDGKWYIVGYCNFDNKKHWNHEEEVMNTDELISLADEHWNNEEYEEAAELFYEAAEQGNAYAQYSIGFCYENGAGTKQDYSKAVEWYTAAAEQEHPDAQYSLGKCYYNGDGVLQNYKKAVVWLKKAAEQGHADAQNYLGACYKGGDGVEQSDKEAVKWYKESAEQGNVFAQNNLAYCYENGEGVEQSYKEAVKWYRKAAEQGHADAQLNLGLCYEDGNGVEQSYRDAVKWYNEAAEQGNTLAQCKLGLCYEYGDGVEQSYKEAVKWYRMAAEQGDSFAQFQLGFCYEDGNGVEQSYQEAVKWYKEAAEQGNARAQNNLGLCYENGNGVEQSYEEAINWYRKAAEQGNAVAYANLGCLYAEGNGVSKDYNKALELYNEAYAKGFENVKEYIDSLTAKMQGKEPATAPQINSNEQEYIETLKDIVEDGEITDRERRLLEKLRTKLGISESRAKELEDALANPSLTAEEQEYLDEYKSIAADGEITDKERKLLDKIRKMSGISEERAREIEKIVFPEKTKFDVIIKATGSKIFDVVKVVKTLTGLGLKETKELIDSVPKTIKEGVTKDEADSIKNQLIEVGADVYIK